MSGATITNQLSCKQHAKIASGASYFKNGLGGAGTCPVACALLSNCHESHSDGFFTVDRGKVGIWAN